MHLTTDISGDDGCVVALQWHNGLLCGYRSTPS